MFFPHGLNILDIYCLNILDARIPNPIIRVECCKFNSFILRFILQTIDDHRWYSLTTMSSLLFLPRKRGISTNLGFLVTSFFPYFVSGATANVCLGQVPVPYSMLVVSYKSSRIHPIQLALHIIYCHKRLIQFSFSFSNCKVTNTIQSSFNAST